MPPEKTTISVKELVELRRKAIAHDDYLDAIKQINLQAYSARLDSPADVLFNRGYNAAILALSDAVLSATLRRMDREGVMG